MSIEIKAHGANLQVKRPTRLVVEMSRELPGRKKFKDGVLHIEGSGANIQVILRHFPEVAGFGIGIVDEYLGVQQTLTKTKTRKEGEVQQSRGGLEFKTTPYDHQQRALDLMAGQKFFGLFMEMGTGKTKILIDDMVRLFNLGEITRALVFAPSGVHQQWVNTELPTHCAAEYTATAYRSSMKKSELALLENNMNDREGLQILTMATPSLSSKKAQQIALDWLNDVDTLVIIDESHQYKNPSAGRTKFLQKVQPKADYRRIATGTELTQGVEDLFTQLRYLHPTILGHKSFYSFRNEFCRTMQIPGAPHGAVKIIGYQNVERLTERVEGCTVRAMKKDCLDLPEKVYTKYPVLLTKEQERVYEELRKYMATELEGKVIEVPLALTLLMKLQQVVSGFMIDDEGETTTFPSNRIQAVLDIMESRKKGIVWSRFRYDLEELEEALTKAGYRVGTFHGGTSAEERLRVVKPDEVDILVANAQSAGTGLNLTHFDTAIYYSNSFNASERWQSEDRIHRIGQKNNCQYIDLVSPKTVDEKILEALLRKRAMADSIRPESEGASLGEEVLSMLFDVRKK